MPAFRLNHVCHRPGCEGIPGQVVDISDEDAAWLTGHGGGQLVAEETAADVATTKTRRKRKTEEPEPEGEDSTEHSTRTES